MQPLAPVLRFAQKLFAGTLLSRISGVLRDVTMAFCFGSAPQIAAFMVAYRLANLFRRLLGEGNFQSSFVPHFESLDSQRGELFYRDTAFSLLAILIAILCLIEALFFGIAHFLTPDWKGIIHLAMWMAPGLIFICLYALNGAYLQCKQSYFAFAAAPILFNIGWILSALATHKLAFEWAMPLLSIGVTLGFFLQWICTASQVRKKLTLSRKQWFRPHLFSPEVRQLIRPLGLGILGVGAMQINSALDGIFARLADASGPAYLWFAIRIEQLPLALFGISLAGALLAPLAAVVREGALDKYRTLLEVSLQHSASLMIFCTFGFFALGESGLNILYGHGDFSSADLMQTLHCLWGYGIGLVPSTFVLLLATGFYARKSYGIPTLASLLSVLVNTALNTFLVFVLKWGALSIAIGTSVASFMNFFILATYSRKTYGAIFSNSFWNHCMKLLICGTLATSLTRLIHPATLSRAFFDQALQFSLEALLFTSSFFTLAYLFKLRTFFALLTRASKR